MSYFVEFKWGGNEPVAINPDRMMRLERLDKATKIAFVDGSFVLLPIPYEIVLAAFAEAAEEERKRNVAAVAKGMARTDADREDDLMSKPQ